MTTPGPRIGDIVRVSAVGPDADVVRSVLKYVESQTPEDMMLPLDTAARESQQDFGSTELINEFVVATVSGITVAGITEAIRASVDQFRRRHVKEIAAPTKRSADVSIVVEAKDPHGGVIEISIRITRE